MNAGTKTILLSTAVLTAATAGVVAGTVALFTAEKTIATHVKTGNLDFKLERTKFESFSVDSNGLLSDTPVVDDTVIDYSTDGLDAFSVVNVVPGSTFVATFVLTNTGSTAFESVVNIVDIQSENRYLLENLYVVITCENQAGTGFNLGDPGDKKYQLSNLLVGEDLEFTIKAELSADADNRATDSELSFALKLEATQLLNQ